MKILIVEQKKKTLLQNKVNELLEEISSKTVEINSIRIQLINHVLAGISGQERGNLPCTCDGEKFNEHIQCIKHPGRHFPNKGCYSCNNTDCSEFGC